MTAKNFFAARDKISRQEVISQVNEILVRKNYVYTAQTHPAKHPRNSFYLHKKSARRAEETYDLALYHSAAQEYRGGHHHHQGHQAVFYMRCEVAGARILFGNLQIDDRGEISWSDPAMGQELRRPKNIYGLMIQQAVKHALQTGRREIMFQAGDACEIAQWNRANFTQLRVTEKNYQQIYKIYAHEQRRYPKGVGLIINKPRVGGEHEVIIKSTPEYYLTRFMTHKVPNLLSAIMILNSPAAALTRQKLCDCAAEVRRGHCPKLFQAHLERLINELTGHRTSPEVQVAQRVALTPILKKERLARATIWDEQFLRVVEAYLVRWGYDKILLKRFRSLRRLDLQSPVPKGYGKYFYYSSQQRSENRTYLHRECTPPVRGRSYIVHKEHKYNINFNPVKSAAPRQILHHWYETVIPEQLKKYGLRYKKVKIITRKMYRPQVAHAWKITGGLEEFTARAHNCFLEINRVYRSKFNAGTCVRISFFMLYLEHKFISEKLL